MAGKAAVLTSKRLHYALDRLSKNALIDLVTDLAVRENGDDKGTDETLAAVIQAWLNPVIRVRGDKPVSLAAHMARLDKYDADYIARRGKFEQVGND
jgi:hypothetical protein